MNQADSPEANGLAQGAPIAIADAAIIGYWLMVIAYTASFRRVR